MSTVSSQAYTPPPPPPVKRKLVGGPKAGWTVTVPSSQKRIDIGWYTGHYELRDDGRFHFVSLINNPDADQKEVA